MSGIFQMLIDIGNQVGTVTSACMYDSGYLTIVGENKSENKKFTISLHIEEEKKDA